MATPRYLGGQAVVEGVMMRGERSYAVAVRAPDGSIELDVRDAPTWADRWSRIPIARGVAALAESLSLGFRALTWSADRQLPEEERLSPRAMGWTIGGALVFFTALFIVIPTLVNQGFAGALGLGGVAANVAEGAIRLAIFIGYLVLISLLPNIRRVFQYHGAEHKSIAAYERGAELTPEAAQRFSTEHVRCGTNFLLTVMVVTIVVYAFIGHTSLGWMITARILLLPLIAGLSYEVIRFAAGHMDRRAVRVLMTPGLALQRLTTREPTLDQLEVGLASLRAVLSAEQLTEVDARPTRVAATARLSPA
ncbi:MAG TPA: DUF1385 domain-containing protein [Acidimicrobiia bacterium]|nr:DUF1385 domain-containing protein [Acidimicrobiia bacterium]